MEEVSTSCGDICPIRLDKIQLQETARNLRWATPSAIPAWPQYTLKRRNGNNGSKFDQQKQAPCRRICLKYSEEEDKLKEQKAIEEAARTLIHINRSNESIDFSCVKRRKYEETESSGFEIRHQTTTGVNNIVGLVERQRRTEIDPHKSRVRRNGRSTNTSTVIAEETMQLIRDYEPPEIPTVPIQVRNIIGTRRSAPFQKQLTCTDIDENQNRFLMNKEEVKKHINPLLNGDENLNEGIKVSVYDIEGKEYPMIYRTWGDRVSNVLICGWKKFVKDHGFEAHQDFVTVWVFRHAIDDRLCFIFSSRKLPVFKNIPKKLLCKSD